MSTKDGNLVYRQFSVDKGQKALRPKVYPDTCSFKNKKQNRFIVPVCGNLSATMTLPRCRNTKALAEVSCLFGVFGNFLFQHVGWACGAISSHPTT